MASRFFAALVIGAGVPVALGIAIACGPPSSFDNITGGPIPNDGGSDGEASAPLVPDSTLEAPRPIAPLTGSWINGSRPHFRWDLAPRGIGARVSVCPDVNCSDATKTKTWSAAGRDLVAPEDLAPGRYFWRVVTTTDSEVGTKTSPVWSMIVRGGAGSGVPAGAISDYNGDGIVDLAVATDFMNPQGEPFHDVLIFSGTSLDDPTAFYVDPGAASQLPLDIEVGVSTNLRFTATDIDGDGLSDAIFTDIPTTGSSGGPPRAYYGVFQGSPGLMNTNQNFAGPVLPGLDVLPSLLAPGDIDGDGHGDLITASKTAAAVVFGAKDSLSTFSFFDQLDPMPDPDAGELPAPTVAIAVGGLDFDSDGLTDVTLASYFKDEGFYLRISAPGRNLGDAQIFSDPLDAGGPSLTPATLFGSGDLDGDGKTEIVFVTMIAGKPAVCAIANTSGPNPGMMACWKPDTVPAGFASSMIAVDLEGDGKDEILVGSASGGVDVLRLTGPDKLEPEHLAIDFGIGLTVLDPGRPKPGFWAATRADGSAVGLFQGKDMKRTIIATTVQTEFTGPPLRFQAGIR